MLHASYIMHHLVQCCLHTACLPACPSACICACAPARLSLPASITPFCTSPHTCHHACLTSACSEALCCHWNSASNDTAHTVSAHHVTVSAHIHLSYTHSASETLLHLLWHLSSMRRGVTTVLCVKTVLQIVFMLARFACTLTHVLHPLSLPAGCAVPVWSMTLFVFVPLNARLGPLLRTMTYMMEELLTFVLPFSFVTAGFTTSLYCVFRCDSIAATVKCFRTCSAAFIPATGARQVLPAATHNHQNTTSNRVEVF